jgi:hypothetical protein
VKKGLQKNAIYDPVPNDNIDQTFLKVMRRRQEHKEIAGQFKYQPRTGVHRVLETL